MSLNHANIDIQCKGEGNTWSCRSCVWCCWRRWWCHAVIQTLTYVAVVGVDIRTTTVTSIIAIIHVVTIIVTISITHKDRRAEEQHCWICRPCHHYWRWYFALIQTTLWYWTNTEKNTRSCSSCGWGRWWCWTIQTKTFHAKFCIDIRPTAISIIIVASRIVIYIITITISNPLMMTIAVTCINKSTNTIKSMKNA